MDRIFIVDDNVDFLSLMQAALKNIFIVDTATTAKDALEYIKKNTYSVIILDMSLPDYTGYFLGKEIRKDNPDIPMAFLTNYDGEITRENVEELNAAFWKKTDIRYTPQVLDAKIKSLYEPTTERISNS